MKLTKKDIQKRVLKNGKPLDLSKFSWDAETKTFSSKEGGLVIDFSEINGLVINCGGRCTIKCGYSCTINCGSACTIDCGGRCTINCGSACTIDCGGGCTIKCGGRCTIKCGHDCTIKCGGRCTIKCGGYCTIDCGSDCAINCGNGCTIDCGSDCAINCGSDCAIKCGHDCTINCGSDCTMNCGHDCTIDCGSGCVIVFRSLRTSVIQPEAGQTIQTPPYDTIDDFIINGEYEGKPYIIADGILSEVISKKGNVYKVKNYGDTKVTYVVQQGDLYSHGATIKEAREDLIYKISDRDTSAYDDLTLDSILTKDECIKMYMTVTGACSEGTKYFVNNQDNVKESYTVAEIIKITQGQYGHSELVKFMEGK